MKPKFKKVLAFLVCLLLLCGVLPVSAEQTVTTVTNYTLPYYFGALPTAKVISGDINGDGAVNNKDLLRFFQYLTGFDVDYVEGALDVNGDSKVNNKDLLRLFKYLSGWEVQMFPVCEHTGGKATCSSKAICELCGKQYGEFDSNNHTGNNELRNVLSPTCTNAGYTGDTYCLDCGILLFTGESVPPTGIHTLGGWSSDADSHYKTCSVCKGKFEQSPHSGGSATCSNKAVCEICGAEYGELNPDNHSGGTEVRDAVAPTCVNNGYTGTTYCSGCNKAISYGTVIEPTGIHINTELRYSSPATCANPGYTGDTYCIDCGSLISKGETIPSTGAHALSGWLSDADSHYKICSGCNGKFEQSPHSGGTSTCHSKAKCAICGAEYGGFDTANHNYKPTVVAPTCTEAGYTRYTCADCNNSYVSDYVSSLGHTGGTATCHSAAKCSRCGTEYGAYNPDNHDGGTTLEGVDTVNGYTGNLICLGCNSVISYGHYHSGGNATYYQKAACDVCGEEYGDYAQMLAYNELTENQKGMYNYLNGKIATLTKGNIYVFDYVKNNPSKADSDINVVIRAISTDHPEYFWMPRNYAVSKYNTISTGALADISIIFAQPSDATNGYYNVPAAQKAQMQTLFDNKVNELLTEANKYETVFEKEAFIHDYLCRSIVYNDDAAADPSVDPLAFTAYGALVNGYCVCEGYSRAMQLLCQRLGVPCSLATGRYMNENNEIIPHMWNIINPGDGCYYLDVTFDDLDSSAYPNLCTHFCFNISKDSIATDHMFDDHFSQTGDYSDPESEFNFFDSHGNNTTMDYYAFNDAYITEDTLESVAAYIDRKRNEGVQIADFLFDYNIYTPQTAMQNINRILRDNYGYDKQLKYGYGYHENWLFIMLAPTS